MPLIFLDFFFCLLRPHLSLGDICSWLLKVSDKFRKSVHQNAKELYWFTEKHYIEKISARQRVLLEKMQISVCYVHSNMQKHLSVYFAVRTNNFQAIPTNTGATFILSINMVWPNYEVLGLYLLGVLKFLAPKSVTYLIKQNKNYISSMFKLNVY